MIFDNSGMIADGLAHGGTPTVIDLGMTSPGPGRQIAVWVSGVGIAGATGVAFSDDADGDADELVLTVTATAAEINAGFEVRLPSTLKRYLTAAFTGTSSAGTWTCGVILDQGQTNA